MKHRLDLIDSHAKPKPAGGKTKPSAMKPVIDVWQSLHLDTLISEEIKTKKKLLAEKLKLVEPKLHEFVEKSEFPHFVVDHLAEIKFGEPFASKQMGGLGSASFDKNSLHWEVCKHDTSIGTFLGVHFALGIATIEACGDDEQKNRMLPDCYALKKITSFGLTEPKYGSDATSMESFAVKAKDGRDGYILNGEKFWIGNGTWADYNVVWAKNRDDGDKI
jgi:glutaryl-CoA dehydrogenase